METRSLNSPGPLAPDNVLFRLPRYGLGFLRGSQLASTKLRWCLALLVCVLTLMGEPTRANIVGYINLITPAGYSYTVNQLNCWNGLVLNNSLTNIVPFPAEGSRVYLYDVTNQVFLAPARFEGGQWDRNADLPPGRGFVFYSPLLWTNTFVGEVMEGWLTNYIAGNNQYSLVGSLVPIGGGLADVLLFPPLDGAVVHLYRRNSQEFSESYTYLNGIGWFDPQQVVGTNGPSVQVPESFFVQNPGSPTNWIRRFVVQVRPPGGGAASLPITTLRVSGAAVELRWNAAEGVTGEVLFSTDRVNWQTVTRQQKGGVWTGSVPDARTGYFQVIPSVTKEGSK